MVKSASKGLGCLHGQKVSFQGSWTSTLTIINRAMLEVILTHKNTSKNHMIYYSFLACVKKEEGRSLSIIEYIWPSDDLNWPSFFDCLTELWRMPDLLLNLSFVNFTLWNFGPIHFNLFLPHWPQWNFVDRVAIVLHFD